MKYASFAHRQAVRNRAASLFAQNISDTQIAHQLGTSRQTANTWRQQWRKHGIDGLAIGTPGYRSRLSDEQWELITQELLLGPEAHGYDTQFWTLERIADLIARKTGVSYHPNYVWELLHRHGWSCQKPERRAKERDEQAIADWKSKRWVEIKKGHKNQALPWSS